MNISRISRIALLSVVFSAPVFSMENQPAETPTTATFLSKVTAFPKNAFCAVFATAPDFISSYSFTPALNAIANNISFLNFECLSKKEQNLIGRAAVLLIAALIIRKACTMLNSTEEIAETDEDHFFDVAADDADNN